LTFNTVANDTSWRYGPGVVHPRYGMGLLSVAIWLSNLEARPGCGKRMDRIHWICRGQHRSLEPRRRTGAPAHLVVAI
jgi:hypothetical protein